jgi:hypothetical protein
MVQEGDEIVKQCIKTIKYSFEIMEMEMDSNEKYVEKFKSFSNEVCTIFFIQNSCLCSNISGIIRSHVQVPCSYPAIFSCCIFLFINSFRVTLFINP